MLARGVTIEKAPFSRVMNKIHNGGHGEEEDFLMRKC
jgi:hypothetical protein